jgi:hypothetical protein
MVHKSELMNTITSNKQEEKQELVQGSKDGSIEEKNFCAALSTVLQYLLADLKKKSRSFKIGVCTILLVVSFITLLKSVIEVSPVAFLTLS